MINFIKNVLFYIFLASIIYIASYFIYAQFNLKSLSLSLPPEVYENKCHIPYSLVNENVNAIKMIVISGGGVAGIFPLTYLNYIEKKTNKPIVKTFNVLSGTSTGGIIVAALTMPNKFNEPKFTSLQVLNEYIKLSQNVMYVSPSRRLFTMNGFIGPLHDIKAVYQNLKSVFGSNPPLKKLLGHIYFTLFNISDSRMEVFDNRSCEASHAEYNTVDVITAGAAANITFSSVSFLNPVNQQTKHYFDASLISKNSFPYIFNRVFKFYPNAKKIIIVYLDSGSFNIHQLGLFKRPYNRFGELQWTVPMLKILYNDQSDFIQKGIENLVILAPKGFISYYYFNSNKYFDIFDGSDENIQAIQAQANQQLNIDQKKLDKLIAELKASED